MERGRDQIDLHRAPARRHLISTALQPAAISAVIIVNEKEQVDEMGRRIKKRAAVFVEEAQRPMAIGKKGQNIRLATELTGFELDMYNYEELPAFKAKLAELRGDPNAMAAESPAEALAAEGEAKVEVVPHTEVAESGDKQSLTPDEGQPLAGEGATAA
jgi:transcription termination/antitermination protein NusA